MEKNGNFVNRDQMVQHLTTNEVIVPASRQVDDRMGKKRHPRERERVFSKQQEGFTTERQFWEMVNTIVSQ